MSTAAATWPACTWSCIPDQIGYIPANAGAQIRATTAFGAKYVDLTYPEDPSPQHISAGAVLVSRNVSTEVNTVFQSLVDVLHQVDPPKLNAVLTAFADAVRGRGQRIGEATTAANDVLAALNPRMGTVQHDWRSLQGAGDAYSACRAESSEHLRCGQREQRDDHRALR